MFTGIVSGLGRIVDTRPLGGDDAHGKRLVIETPAHYLDDVRLGDSIALSGACMTVVAFDKAASRFEIDISTESLDKTAGLDALRAINLEKAMRADERLGGHLVSGHVDGVGVVVALDDAGESQTLRIRAPQSLARFLAQKGSVAVDGVSLTVNAVIDQSGAPATNGSAVGDSGKSCEIAINVIPHTLTHTTLGNLRPGSKVNLEIDLIARYVERMLSLQARD